MNGCSRLSLTVPGLISLALGVVGGCGADEPERVSGGEPAALTAGALPGGTGISVSIDTPSDGSTHSPGAIATDGTASVGMSVPVAQTTIIYVIDVSGSTVSATGCGGDQNGDGASNTVLDCEIAAAIALNDQAIAQGNITNVGIVVFGSTAGIGDLDDVEAGTQILVAPDANADGDGTADVVEVLRSAFIGGGLNQFALVSVGGATSYGAGVAAALAALGASSEPSALVVLLSDGVNNTGPSLATAFGGPPPAGIPFHTFAIGSAASCTAGSAGLGNLQDLADATGGNCVNVPNVAALPNILPAVIMAQLVDVELLVDGASQGSADTVAPPLPQVGPAAVDWDKSLSILTPGPHTICARAHGTDAGGASFVEECVDILINSPPVAVCQDLDLSADAACQANGSVDAGSFDPDGDVISCVQSPPGPYSLGATAVTLTCTDPFGAVASCNATVTVVDTTPPQVVTVGAPIPLWPPNHKYQSVGLDQCVVSIVDNCDGALDVGNAGEVLRASSDEVEDAGGGGDGNTCEDARITGATSVDVRRERQGGGDGRVYQIGYQVSDAAGNATPATCTLHVPHDQGHPVATDSGCSYCVGAGCGVCPGPDPGC